MIGMETTTRVEYHKWFSPSLGQDMELKAYGWYGKPVLVFPSQPGRFYEFDEYGMIDAIRPMIDGGRIKVYTIDSVDDQSWRNLGVTPAERVTRHEQYDHYVYHEVIPFIKNHCANTPQKFLATGVSMGAYHSANFFFRHPDVMDALVAMSGYYRLDHFIGDYKDDAVYYNSPLFYLPNLEDAELLETFRRSRIVICAGQGAQEDRVLKDTRDMQQVLKSKGIPAWIDVWGHDVNHDWQWWRRMLPYFLDRVL